VALRYDTSQAGERSERSELSQEEKTLIEECRERIYRLSERARVLRELAEKMRQQPFRDGTQEPTLDEATQLEDDAKFLKEMLSLIDRLSRYAT
jgi:hypothetical protein